MPKENARGRGRCVHCLNDDVELTSDHVFPISWYPRTSALNVEKWQVPSCLDCNRDLGKVEDDFKLRMGMCLDPSDPASASVVADALRALNPASGKNPRDAFMRAARREKFLREMLQGKAIPSDGVYPGFEEKWDRSREQQSAVLMPRASIVRITEKIVRGIFFIENRRFIELPFKIGTYVVDPGTGVQIRSLMGRARREYAREPGVIVRRAVAQDGLSSIFEIELWRQLRAYAVVSDRDEKQAKAA